MIKDRQSKIRDHLFQGGETAVQELATSVGVSLATLRRDLKELEDAGVVERLHGSARISRGGRREAAFDQRESSNLLAKRAIADRAFQQVDDGCFVFLDAGTTVLQLARKIVLSDISLNVVTNGLAIARELAPARNVSVTVLGGRLRRENMSTTGPLAGAMLGGLWFDRVFLGASAISHDGWLTSYDAEEASLNAQMATRTDAISILADHSKLGHRAAYAVLRLSKGQTFLTDQPPAPEFCEFSDQVGVQLIVTETGQ